MAQHTSLARALARNPGVLLLDVHTSVPATVLLVTHDIDEALQLATKAAELGRAAVTWTMSESRV